MHNREYVNLAVSVHLSAGQSMFISFSNITKDNFQYIYLFRNTRSTDYNLLFATPTVVEHKTSCISDIYDMIRNRKNLAMK